MPFNCKEHMNLFCIYRQSNQIKYRVAPRALRVFTATILSLEHTAHLPNSHRSSHVRGVEGPSKCEQSEVPG